MIKLESVADNGMITKDTEYYVGGILIDTNRIVVMDTQGQAVPGNYDMMEVFGIEKEDLIDMIADENKQDVENSLKYLKRKTV